MDRFVIPVLAAVVGFAGTLFVVNRTEHALPNPRHKSLSHLRVRSTEEPELGKVDIQVYDHRHPRTILGEATVYYGKQHSIDYCNKGKAFDANMPAVDSITGPENEVGFISWVKNWDSSFGTGVGFAVISAALDELERRGVRIVYLNAGFSDTKKKGWERVGFQQVITGIDWLDEKAPLMRMDLD
jgi:hypothetical protein